MEEYGKNPIKVIGNDSINLVKYLWQRYRWLATTFSIIYFIFMTTTMLTILWCYSANSCQEFVELGVLNLPFLILTRILMLTSYIFLVFLETISIASKRLKHFGSFYNIVDFLVLVGFIPTLILILVDSDQ